MFIKLLKTKKTKVLKFKKYSVIKVKKYMLFSSRKNNEKYLDLSSVFFYTQCTLKINRFKQSLEN